MNLYNFYFEKVASPIQIQAQNKIVARMKLASIPLSEKYQGKSVIGESVTALTFGVNSRMEKGVKLVWVGIEHSKGGWMEEKEFEIKFCK